MHNMQMARGAPATTFQWSALCGDDAEKLFEAQNQMVLEHERLTQPYSSAVFDQWKTVLGYPADDARRREFISNMPSGSTKHGNKLHCLKLTCHQGSDSTTAGFIEFEVRKLQDALSGNIREIYIRSLIVSSRMRREGCGTRLYNAMFEYLGLGDLDVVRLYVVDLNKAAISLYFKLGFKVTQWFCRRLGDESGFKVIFLCMQQVQGERLNSDKPGALSISLQDMPHIFKEQAVGEIIRLVRKGGSCEWAQPARIEEYHPESRTFTIKHVLACGERLVPDVCVNDLYSDGSLTFERPPSVRFNEDCADDEDHCDDQRQWPSSKLCSPVRKCGTRPSCTVLALRGDSSGALGPSGLRESTANAAASTALAIRGPSGKAGKIAKESERLAEEKKIGYSLQFSIRQNAGKNKGKLVQVGPWTSIKFKDENPKKAGTMAYRNYERYKVARTILDYCKLQGPKRSRTEVKMDLDFDILHGYAKCPDRERPRGLAAGLAKSMRKASASATTARDLEPGAATKCGVARMLALENECFGVACREMDIAERKRTHDQSSSTKAAIENGPALKCARAPNADSSFLHQVKLRVFAGGKINVGLQVDELGFIVCDTDSAVQPALRLDDVIVAVGGTPFVGNMPSDLQDKQDREEARSKMQQCLGDEGDLTRAVVGSYKDLRHRSLKEVRSALEEITQSSTAKLIAKYSPAIRAGGA